MSDKGILYVVATPIGNLQDITFRAVDILNNVDLIVCEDTRVTSVLLNKFGINKPMIAVNEFNEEQTLHNVIKRLETVNVALVSDAGTPLISDPGYRLVETARRKGFKVIPIPGATALIAALSASGLPTDKFLFLGFLSKSKTKIKKILAVSSEIGATIVLYESPHRILQTLSIIQEIFGDIEITLARELTKKFEDIISIRISEHLEGFKSKQPKGEFVILFSTKK